MDKMSITKAQYEAFEGSNVSIKATIDGDELIVPLDPANRHYDEIMRQQSEGLLTIEDAE